MGAHGPRLRDQRLLNSFERLGAKMAEGEGFEVFV